MTVKQNSPAKSQQTASKRSKTGCFTVQGANTSHRFNYTRSQCTTGAITQAPTFLFRQQLISTSIHSEKGRGATLHNLPHQNLNTIDGNGTKDVYFKEIKLVNYELLKADTTIKPETGPAQKSEIT